MLKNILSVAATALAVSAILAVSANTAFAESTKSLRTMRTFCLIHRKKALRIISKVYARNRLGHYNLYKQQQCFIIRYRGLLQRLFR